MVDKALGIAVSHRVHGRAAGRVFVNRNSRGRRMAAELSVTSADLDSSQLVTVAGEVDVATAPELAEYLAQFASDLARS